MNFLQSVSVTCATISAITVYHYMFAWSKLIALNSEGYFLSNTNRYFLGKGEDTKFTEKQKSMVAVSFLIIICSIIEIILAIAAIRSSNIDVQGPQESQVSEVKDWPIVHFYRLKFRCNRFEISLMVSQSIIRSISLAVSQSVSQLSISQSAVSRVVSWWVGQSVNWSVSQSVSQVGGQSVSQSVSKSVSQSGSQSVSQLASRLISRSAEQSTGEPFSYSVSQSVSGSSVS